MIKSNFILLLLISILNTITKAQDIPLVYELENSGSDCVKPILPDPIELLSNPFLPNPFEWSDGSGSLDTFPDWECRRNEIKAEIETYEIGIKPDKPVDITATFSDSTITVIIKENGETLTLSSEVVIPEGEGPFPVVIGMNSNTGGLPSHLFEGVIQIPFNHNQVTTYYGYQNTDAFFKLYPEQNVDNTGQYAAWSWGISRLIDGIQMVENQMGADANRIAVTGCSYAGKMALFAGAFDERIALTIAQESGGGGVNSWRVCETIGDVEKLGNTNYDWFKNSLKSDFSSKPASLPYDHHELMAMIVPRALLVLGNPSQVWLGDESGYVASRAVEEVYKKFDIEDRFGFSFRTDHPHCQLPTESNDEVIAFVDKFLFYSDTANTIIRVHDFYHVDYNKWIAAWKEPANPNAPRISIISPDDGITLDAPATFTFETMVRDTNNDVAKVIFYNKGLKVHEDTSAPYNFTYTDATPGAYGIYAEAIDKEGLKGYSNAVNVNVKAPTLEVFITTTPPTIDGFIEPVWTNEDVSSIEANNQLVGTDFSPNNISGKAKLLWDNSNIYLLAEVVDDVKKNDSPNTYEDDNVEFYFDVNNAKASSYDSDDVQYSFAWNDGSVIGTLPAGYSTEGVVYKVVDNDKGYTVEAKIPWESIKGNPLDEQLIGFDFMINDDDNGDGRDRKLSWNASADQAWQDASYFGTIKLNSTKVIVSVDKNKELDRIKIYPNPANYALIVDGLENEFYYKIYDQIGRVQKAGLSTHSIDIESLSNGVYLLKVEQGSQKKNLSFVKN